MTRKKLPDRRASWTQKVYIEGKAFYLNCGEYEDRTLGEIFITVDKEGTFLRGTMDGLARMASIALQCGAPVESVIGALRHLNFPPNGPVSNGMKCSSVLDWIAQELEAVYARSGSGGVDVQSIPDDGSQHRVEPEGRVE